MISVTMKMSMLGLFILFSSSGSLPCANANVVAQQTLGLRGGADVEVPMRSISPIKKSPSSTMCPLKRVKSFGELSSNDYEELMQHMWKAAENGNIDEVEMFIKQGAWSNHIRQDKPLQVGALHIAAMKGHSNMIARLVSLGADVHLPNRQGLTALHFAAQCGQMKAVHALVALGADVEVVDRYNDTPIDKAEFAGHDSVAQFLKEVRDGDKHSILHTKYKFRHETESLACRSTFIGQKE